MSKDKVKKFGDLAYEYIRKKLIKPGKGGITSLPTDKEITDEMLVMFENLREAGYNVTNIGKEVKNADDLGFLINRIEQAKINQAKEFSDAADALETIQYKLNNNIPLNPDDQKKLLGKGFTTASEAFQGFKPKIIQGGKREVIQPKNAKQDVIAANENLAGGANYAKGDTKYNADILAEEIAKSRGIDVDNIPVKDKIKLYGEAYDYLTEFNRLNKLPKKEGIKSLDLAKELEELTNKNLKERGLGEIKLGDKLPEPKKKKPAVDPELQKSEDTKKMIKDFEERNERALEDFVDDAGGTKEGVEFDDEPFDAAEGGRALMFKGGISKLIQKFKGKTKDKKAGDKIYGVGGEEIDVADFKKSLGLDEATDKKGMEDLEKKLQMIIGKDRTKHNMGGIARVGMVKGGGLFKFLSENSPLQAYKKYLKSVKERAQKDDIGLVPEMLALSSAGILGNRALQRKLKSMDPREEEKKDKKAMGGRIGFKEGGGMTRRTFLKLLGGLASIPLVGKFLKPAAKATKAVEVASKSSGVPAYFPKLVEKIQLLGDDVSKTRATGERQIVKEYKGYELTEEMDTGKLTIKRDNYTSEEYLQFEPGGQYYDETRKKVIKYPDEYEEVTVKPDYEGKMKDVDYGLDSYDEILREVGETKVKKASGGLAYMMGE